MASITCGNCKWTHISVAEVKACYTAKAEGRLQPCTWLVEKRYFDFDDIAQVMIVECEAPAIYTDEGFTCQAGHSHVDAAVLARRGQAYAEDGQEAWLLSYHGVTALRMDGMGEFPEGEMVRPAGY